MNSLLLSIVRRKWVLSCFYFLLVLSLSIYSSFFPHDPSDYNYFADPKNILNRLGAKWAWLWTTILPVCLIILLVIHHTSYSRARSRKASWWLQNPSPLPQIAAVLFRWGSATVFWFVFTQWCIGPSLLDKIQVATGGSCFKNNFPLNNVFNEGSCKKVGGAWVGGWDVSGHCFLMIHSSLYIMEETLQFFVGSLFPFNCSSDNTSSSETSSEASDSDNNVAISCSATMPQPFSADSSLNHVHHSSKSPLDKKRSSNQDPAGFHHADVLYVSQPFYSSLYMRFLVGATVCFSCFILLWWLILLTGTSLFFHTLSEKVVGSFLGTIYWFIFYNFVFPRLKLSS